jgi:3-carboxy-cis,cis-muconate cycloisomerase
VGVAALGSTLGLLGGALGKVGTDVVLLTQDEVGELCDTTAGGSSSMAHKANPVAAVGLVACAKRLPGLVATLQSLMLGEHQRAAGAWHAEWETISDLLRLTGGAAAWARSLLERLQVVPRRMQENLIAAAERHGFDATVGIAEASALVDRALLAR